MSVLILRVVRLCGRATRRDAASEEAPGSIAIRCVAGSEHRASAALLGYPDYSPVCPFSYSRAYTYLGPEEGESRTCG